jgi:hypothetical protein
MEKDELIRIAALLRECAARLEALAEHTSGSEESRKQPPLKVVRTTTVVEETIPQHTCGSETVWEAERPHSCPNCASPINNTESACLSCGMRICAEFLSAREWAVAAIGEERVARLENEYSEKYPGIQWMSTPRVWRTPGGFLYPTNPYSPHILALDDLIRRLPEYDEAVRQAREAAEDFVNDVGRSAHALFAADFRGADDEHTAYAIARHVWSHSHRGTTLPGKRKSDAWRELAGLIAEYGVAYVASVLDTFFRIREWGAPEEVAEIERFGYPVRMVTQNFGRWELLHQQMSRRPRPKIPLDPLLEYRRLLDAAWIAHAGAYARHVASMGGAPWEE